MINVITTNTIIYIPSNASPASTLMSDISRLTTRTAITLPSLLYIGETASILPTLRLYSATAFEFSYTFITFELTIVFPVSTAYVSRLTIYFLSTTRILA